jgi:hypothetical protein
MYYSTNAKLIKGISLYIPCMCYGDIGIKFELRLTPFVVISLVASKKYFYFHFLDKMLKSQNKM